MPEPAFKKEIQRLLGLINYVAEFLPKLSEVKSPMRELLQKNVNWYWEEHYKKWFEDVKKLLSSDRCLAFFDVSKSITIQLNAGNSGLGAALLPERKPAADKSRSLTSAEKNYAIIEKELLAVLFGCGRFHQYVYENKTFIESDHNPLESIMKCQTDYSSKSLSRISGFQGDHGLLYLHGLTLRILKK